MSRAVLPELAPAERAEDFFDALGVPYDPAVVDAHRTRILRLFGRALAALQASAPFLGEEGLRATLRGALRDAHEAAASGVLVPVAAPAGQVVQLRRRGAG